METEPEAPQPGGPLQADPYRARVPEGAPVHQFAPPAPGYDQPADAYDPPAGSYDPPQGSYDPPSADGYVRPGGETSTGPRPAAPSKGWRPSRGMVEWGVILLVVVVAALFLRSSVVQAYYIPSGSMETTLDIGDKVLVNKLAYDFHAVHRGDVIVFAKPSNDYDPGVSDLIKRVIGLPGETISARGGQVYINGSVIKQPWLPKGITTADFGPVKVPSGEYFVMGDNRGNSDDSRIIGPIPKHLIVGRAFLIIWPLGRLHTL